MADHADSSPDTSTDSSTDAVLDRLLAAGPDALPNTFLAGAMKSGTTWLASLLARHPQVCVPGVKEPNTLVLDPAGRFPLKGPRPEEELFTAMHAYSVGDADEYAALYATCEQPIRLDASIRYLMSDRAADRIASAVPNAKILVMLRDPVQRAWSHWQMHRQMGVEPLGFRAALNAEPARLAEGWSDDYAYAGYSAYDAQLDRYLSRFDRDRVHVEIYEEATADPTPALARVAAFLGIDPDAFDTSRARETVGGKKRVASSGVEQVSNYYRPGWRTIIPKPLRHAAWLALRSLNRRGSQRTLPDREAARLAAALAPSVGHTASILGRDLPWGRA